MVRFLGCSLQKKHNNISPKMINFGNCSMVYHCHCIHPIHIPFTPLLSTLRVKNQFYLYYRYFTDDTTMYLGQVTETHKNSHLVGLACSISRVASSFVSVSSLILMQFTNHVSPTSRTFIVNYHLVLVVNELICQIILCHGLMSWSHSLSLPIPGVVPFDRYKPDRHSRPRRIKQP